MLTSRVESKGAVSAAQAQIINIRDFFDRRIRYFDVWRERVRSCDARMAARYPGLYAGDTDTLDARREVDSRRSSSPTENVNRRHRRSDVRDKISLEIIRACDARDGVFSGRSSVHEVTPPISTPSTPSAPSRASSISTRHTPSDASLPTPSNDDDDLLETYGDGRALPSWEYAGVRLKLSCYGRAVSASSGGLAFTLNLSPANENKAKTLGADWLRKRVAHHLEASLGLRGVVLVLEATGGRKGRGKAAGGVAGRIHAHGIIEANSNEIVAVEGALKAAGGGWANSRGSEHQVYARPLTDTDGWVRYVLEDQAHTRRVTGHDRLVSVSRSLTAPGRTVFEDLRKKISRKM